MISVVLELLVEMAGQQQNGIFQLALAVGERALAEFAGHHDGAENDGRDQQAAADDQPERSGRGIVRGKTPRVAAVLGTFMPCNGEADRAFPTPQGDMHTMREMA